MQKGSIKDPAPVKLIWQDGNIPISAQYGDLYYHREDALGESFYVFLQGIGAEDLFSGRASLTLGEVGFGMGVNFLSAWRHWKNHAPKGARLHYVAIEQSPPRLEDLSRALSRFPEFEKERRALEAIWKVFPYGVHRFGFDQIILTLLVAPASDAIEWLDRADGFGFEAWFLDGFAPACNPALWHKSLLEKIYDLTVPGGRIASFSAAGSFRRDLESCGFTVERRPGFRHKRHAVTARKEGALPPSPLHLPRKKITIIGAGIAGRSLALALQPFGVELVVYDSEEKGAASLQKAIMVHPRPALQNNRTAPLFFHAWMKARHFYPNFPEALFPSREATRLSHDDKTDQRFERLEQEGVLSQYGIFYTSPQKHDRATLFFPEAFFIAPEKLFSSMQQRYAFLIQKKNIQKYEGLTVIAAGIGSTLLPESAMLPVKGKQGQYSIIRTAQKMDKAYAGALCAFALDDPYQLCVGTTHRKWYDGFSEKAEQLSDEQHQENLLALKKYIPFAVDPCLSSEQEGNRAGVRSVSRDRVPMVGALCKDTYILSGLSGHGYLSAPLLGDILAGQLMQCPFPAAGMSTYLAPKRFLSRKVRSKILPL